MMYSKSMWFDLEHLQNGAWPGARPGRPPTCSPRATTGSSPIGRSVDDAGASHHRRSARQGVLSMVKRCSEHAARGMTFARFRPAGSPAVSSAVSVAVLALLAYVPALTAAPGRMPTDSKLYVYLDPGRFLGRHDRPRSTPASTPGGCRTSTSPTCGRPGRGSGSSSSSASPTGSPTGCGSARCCSPPDSACAGRRGCSGSGPTAALDRGDRLPALAVHPPVRVAHVGPAPPVRRARAGSSASRCWRRSAADGGSPPASRSWCSPSAPSTPRRWR